MHPWSTTVTRGNIHPRIRRDIWRQSLQAAILGLYKGGLMPSSQGEETSILTFLNQTQGAECF